MNSSGSPALSRSPGPAEMGTSQPFGLAGPAAAADPAALDAERRYLHALIDGVREQLAQGGSMQQAIAQVAAAEKPHWLLWDSTHARNVARVYQELEWE